jgi:hypothetical protein
MSALTIANEGITDIASTPASPTGLPSNHIDFDLPIPGIVHTACPHHYRPGHKKLDRRHRGNLPLLIIASQELDGRFHRLGLALDQTLDWVKNERLLAT